MRANQTRVEIQRAAERLDGRRIVALPQIRAAEIHMGGGEFRGQNRHARELHDRLIVPPFPLSRSTRDNMLYHFRRQALRGKKNRE